MSLMEILIFGACCVLGAATQSVSGFGFALVLVAILPPCGFAIQPVVILIGLLVIPNLAIAFWRLRRHASLRRVAWVLAGMPIGVPVGICLLTQGPAWLVHGLLGAVLVFAAAEPFLLPRLEPRPAKAAWALAAGVACGALGAAFGTGGPPLVIYFYGLRWSKEVTKASLVLLFAVNVALRTAGYACEGLITWGAVIQAAAFSPAVILGTVLGERGFQSLGQEGFRRVAAGMLILCGAYQIARAAGAF